MLLERQRELDTLAALIRSASDGAGGAALLEGQAGIGKTVLVAAACEQAAEAGMTVLSARAGEYESGFAWGVVRQLFELTLARANEQERAALLSEAAGLARPALGLETAEGPADEVAFSTLHGLYWLTVNLAQRRPLMLAVDDLQWADQPSLRFVSYLVSRIAGLPLLLVLAARPAPAGPVAAAAAYAQILAEPAVAALRPAALSPAASASVVRQSLFADASESFCTACHEVSGGNPFLLHELLGALSDADVAPGDVDDVRRMTPARVSRSVLLRLSRLPDSASALARAAAVLGERTEFSHAAALAGLEPDEAARAGELLIRAGILTAEEPAAFVHPLVRAAIYGEFAEPERSHLHQRAAHLLAAEHVPPDELAVHLLAALPSGDQWTVDQLRAAAAGARVRGAPDIAAACLRRALEEPPAADARVDLLLELGEVEGTQDPAAAVAPLQEALALSAPGSLRARIVLALGTALAFSGRFLAAIPVLESGLAELGEDAAELRPALEAALLGAARWDLTAQELRHRLVAELQQRAAGGERLDPREHAALATEMMALGADLETSVEHAHAAMATFDALLNSGPVIVGETISVLIFAGLDEEAQAAVGQFLGFVRRNAWPLGVALAASIASLAAQQRGDVSEAIASAREAIEPSTDGFIPPLTVSFLIDALAERGEAALARAELGERGLDGELPRVWPFTPLILHRGRLHATLGDHKAAVADLLAAGELSEAWRVHNPAMMPWRSSAALSLAQLGDQRRALHLADEEIELARRWGSPRGLGVALRAAGVIGGNDGLLQLREAVSVLERSPAQLEHARALTDLGTTLRRLGRRAEAREHLQLGHDIARQLGGAALAERAREELAVAGARARRATHSGRDALTPSELRVAQFAADGHTNQQIAQALFITLRTVETHLSSAYGKLGIASRGQLAQALEVRS